MRKLLGGLGASLVARSAAPRASPRARRSRSRPRTRSDTSPGRYHAQGRNLSAEDLKSLFTRFQAEAKALFPKVEQQIHAQAKTVNVKQLLGLRG